MYVSFCAFGQNSDEIIKICFVAHFTFAIFKCQTCQVHLVGAAALLLFALF